MKTLTKILMALSMSFGLAACGPDGGPVNSDWVGHPVDPAMPTGVAQFVGAWKYESLDARVTCSDGTEGPYTTVSGTETFTRGERRDEVIGVDEEGCRSVCHVAETTATCQSACAGDDVTVDEDVYTSAGGKLSEFSRMHATLPDGTDCVASGTAVLIPVK